MTSVTGMSTDGKVQWGITFENVLNQGQKICLQSMGFCFCQVADNLKIIFFSLEGQNNNCMLELIIRGNY